VRRLAVAARRTVLRHLNGAAPINSATATADLTAFGYYRGFDFFGRSANFALAIPYEVGEFSGTVADAPEHARRSGFLDSSLRFSVNLIGGPAMEPKEFANWRQDRMAASLNRASRQGQRLSFQTAINISPQGRLPCTGRISRTRP
jgi:hypothetical protein